MRTDNSHAIIVLCSHLCKGDGVVPLEPAEWTECAEKLLKAKKQPSDIFYFSCDDFANILGLDKEQIERYNRLRDRSASIAMECSNWESRGIFITTRADANYPTIIKKKLAKKSPPLFYYCGNVEITIDECIGFVGSRNIEPNDAEFTRGIVKKCLNNGYTVVSGGAKGVDSTAADAMKHDGAAIEYVADSLSNRIKEKDVLNRIRDNRLLILSAAIPTAGFNVGMAMQRNKYIYAQSLGTVVVRSDYKKGGTWAGATENLRHNFSHTFCWNNSSYRGNMELIKLGAIPIDEAFDPDDVKKTIHSEPKTDDKPDKENKDSGCSMQEAEQLSLIDEFPVIKLKSNKKL